MSGVLGAATAMAVAKTDVKVGVGVDGGLSHAPETSRVSHPISRYVWIIGAAIGDTLRTQIPVPSTCIRVPGYWVQYQG